MPTQTQQLREQRRAQARDLYLSGLGLDDVAAELGVAHGTVWKDLVALGVPRRRVGAPSIPVEPRVCERTGCGKVFTPRHSQVTIGAGRFCSKSCASGRPPQWITCAWCGNEHKAFSVQVERTGARFCSHSCWMLFNWKHGIAISDATAPLAKSWRTKQKMKAKWAGPKGAAHGIKGGRPVETTVEQRQKMNECLNAGLSQRQTAIAVFGDAKYRKRVRSFVGS